MAKKCLGVREGTGDPCKRSAGKGSDFCFAHRPQEGNEKLLNLQHDVYHCPDDGQKLWYVPKWKQHRCDMCGGVLLNAKEIDPVILENILELSEIAEEGLVVECPTCSTDSDLSDGEPPLSNFAVEWAFYVSKSQYHGVTYRGVSNVGHCNVCGSTWFPGPGERDALGKKIGNDRRHLWRDRLRISQKNIPGPGERDTFGKRRMRDEKRDYFSKQGQSWIREVNLREVTKKREKREKIKEKLCQHVDSNGERCNRRKTQKEGSEYCFKHRPK